MDQQDQARARFGTSGGLLAAGFLVAGLAVRYWLVLKAPGLLEFFVGLLIVVPLAAFEGLSHATREVVMVIGLMCLEGGAGFLFGKFISERAYDRGESLYDSIWRIAGLVGILQLIGLVPLRVG